MFSKNEKKVYQKLKFQKNLLNYSNAKVKKINPIFFIAGSSFYLVFVFLMENKIKKFIENIAQFPHPIQINIYYLFN